MHIIYKTDRDSFIEEFNGYLDSHRSGYLLVVSPEDTYERGRSDEKALRHFADRMADKLRLNPSAVLVTPKLFFQFPDRICGIMFNLDNMQDTELRLDPELRYNYEADYLLRLISTGDYMIGQDIEYIQSEPGDGNYREFAGIYDRAWYIDNLENYLIPMLSSYEGELPVIVQQYALYNITCRLEANQNNNNRHVLSGDDIDLFQELISRALQYIDDDMIISQETFPAYKRDFQFGRMLYRIKYKDQTRDALELYDISRLRCNIQLIDIRQDHVELDGSVPDSIGRDRAEYYFRFGDREYPVEHCERFSLTKYFGRPAYKRLPFHVSIPIEAYGDLEFYVRMGGVETRVPLEFKSHTSRLSAYPRLSYWHAGRYLLTTVRERLEGRRLVTAIRVSRYNYLKMALREIGVGGELLLSFQMHRFRFFLLRAAWVVTRPYFRGKNIWMFFDKIYKAGDSAEYLYRYTADRMQHRREDAAKGIDTSCYPDRIYYLVDEKSSDYKRLISDGFRPLRRGSFLHRLAFLNADMMIVSNSTVFAFNDYYLENSRYIRGIPDFHTVCVQHGLSVQKIALAQQRLRDNTRLYFCASKYEIENLSHPVYDYVGYNALRLTGVPRYDGLIDDDKRQIMISPTWRMQSAMLVSKNEGVERDYNSHFRETPYYQVYNSLINDERLLEAARRYDYRIVYVLHPIVSPQAGDFDSNDSVEIIPAVGDMSYEKLFRESSLMVTDYSGIQFDFAYMRKPLVYYHPEELEAHYEEGVYHYDTMAFGEIVSRRDELVELLISYMESGCRMKPEYIRRADDFYEYSDHHNSERIFYEMTKYQKELRQG